MALWSIAVAVRDEVLVQKVIVKM